MMTTTGTTPHMIASSHTYPMSPGTVFVQTEGGDDTYRNPVWVGVRMSQRGIGDREHPPITVDLS